MIDEPAGDRKVILGGARQSTMDFKEEDIKLQSVRNNLRVDVSPRYGMDTRRPCLVSTGGEPNLFLILH